MKRSAIILLHLGYWLVYLAIWGVVLMAINQRPYLAKDNWTFYFGLIVGVAIIPAIFTFYIFYYFLFPSFLQKRQIFKALGWSRN